MGNHVWVTVVVCTVHVIMYTTQGICVGVGLLYICMTEGSSPLVCGM